MRELLGNVSIWFNERLGGTPGTPLCARLGRRAKRGNCRWCAAFCKVMDLYERGHCERMRRRYPQA